MSFVIPLRVLGKQQCLSHSNAAAWLNLLSANTIHITATGSGHEIHLHQPEVVIKALFQVISSVRNATPLSGPDAAKSPSLTPPAKPR